MAERTNLIVSDNPKKYILGSLLLLVASGIGIFLILGNKENNKNLISEENNLVTPTKSISITPKIEVIPTEKIASESNTIKISPTIKIATATATKAISATPSVKALESYENTEAAFACKYESKRKLIVEKEASGTRYVFANQSGNITVHTGKSWSWVSSGRTFSDKQLIDGEKSYIYEISNQKIVDIEIGDQKYTIQCVHNAIKELKSECEKFLEEFKFI